MKKGMVLPTDEENTFRKKEKMLYMQKDLVLMIIKSIIKSEITVTTQENIEELLMIFAIQDKKHQTKFL